MGDLWKSELRKQIEPHKGSQQGVHFISRSLSKGGRHKTSVRRVMLLNESAVESGKDLRIRDTCLPPVSPAIWMQSYRSPSLCLVWNPGRHPMLLPLCPYYWNTSSSPPPRPHYPPPHTHPSSVLPLCLLVNSHSVSGFIALSNRDDCPF